MLLLDSAPLLHHFSLGGKISPVLSPVKLFTPKASFSQVAIPVKCLFSKSRSLYTVAWNVLLWVFLIFIYLFIIGILGMGLHMGFFVFNT